MSKARLVLALVNLALIAGLLAQYKPAGGVTFSDGD
jgi:hypothetical protein